MTKDISISLPRTTCDVIKVVAMLLVVTAHMGTVALGSAYNATNPVFYIMATQSGYTGVAIFFFLSGYGLMESERKKHLSLPLFVRKRFGKIYIPTLLVTAIWLIVSIIGRGARGGDA